MMMMMMMMITTTTTTTTTEEQWKKLLLLVGITYACKFYVCVCVRAYVGYGLQQPGKYTTPSRGNRFFSSPEGTDFSILSYN
jgi:hypothetical protein